MLLTTKMDKLGVLLVILFYAGLISSAPYSSLGGAPNPCYFGVGELYHSYPGDPSQYIQCSEWGQSYVHQCGHGKVWRQQLKTCVQDFTSSLLQNTNSVNNYDHPQYAVSNSYSNDRDTDYNSWYGPLNDPSTADTSAQGNSLWNRYQTMFSNIGNSAANQGNYRLQGQEMSGQTNIHQTSNHQYAATNYQQMSDNRAPNSLWDRYASGVTAKPTYPTAAAASYYMPSYPSTPAPTTYPSVMYQQASYTQDTSNTYTSYPQAMNMRVNTQNQWMQGSNSNSQVSNAFKSRSQISSYAKSAPQTDTSRMISAQRQAPTFHQPEGSFDVPEICRNSELRYVASPTDSTHFYECVRGKATVKSCPDDQIWVQPLRKCVDVRDNSNSLPSHNPCISSEARFHPYPTDPSKYVECQSWFRVYVWKCKSGLWTQKSQKCTDENGAQLNIERSYQPDNTVMHRHHMPEKFRGYCDKRNFYYANENKAKYIQCDEFGKWFLKDCPMNTTWDDSLKVCVVSLVPEPLPTYNTGYQDYNTGNANDMNSFSRKLPADFDGTPATYPCPQNYAWDVTRNSCVAISLSDYLPPCSRGYRWDEDIHDCVPYADPMDVEPFPDAAYAEPNCPGTHQWDTAQHMCLPHGQQVETGNMILDALSISSSAMDYTADYSQENNQLSATLLYEYADENVCNRSDDQFYFAFPGQPQMFIQCDQFGTQHTQYCGLYQIWNDDIKTCVQHIYGNDEPADSQDNMMNGYQDMQTTSTTGTYMNGGNYLSNVCSLNPDVTYHSDPADKSSFIMCHNYVGYKMACPYGSYWQDEVLTCNWPEV